MMSQRKPTTKTASLFLSLCCMSSFACADIVLTTGDVVEVPAPASVRQDVTESNTQILAFFERGTVLSTDVLVDIVDPGTYDENGDLPSPQPSIPAGTKIESYFLHFDPVVEPGTLLEGSVEFDTDVLGVMVLSQTIFDTHATLGNPLTLYPTNGALRGLEFDTDSIVLSADRRTIDVSFEATNRIDSIRVLTPEPSSALFLIAGLLFALRLRRRGMSR